ncbi:MAG: PKD domain-containing protein, partial [Bradymonadia bacterium]
ISVDWGDGASTQGVVGRFFSHEYAVTTDRTYGVTVTAIDPQGASGVGTATIVFEPFQNEVPIELDGIEVARNGFVWVGQFNAYDPDGDELTYTIDFRDGSNVVVSRTGLVRHVFPSGQYQTYAALVTASDGLGGQISFTYDIDFPSPALNQPPVITTVSEILRDERNVVVKVDVVDPDGDEIQVDFEWGDGFELRDQTTFIAAHQYGNDANEYQLRVVASDSQGGQSEAVYEMAFDPPVQNQAPVFVDTRELSRNGGEILFLAQAIDPEGAALRYRWRFDDGSPDIQTETPFLSHEFPADVSGNYVVEVRAIDEQGSFVDTQFDVTITPPPPNLVPVILSTHVVHLSQYEVMVFIDAYDPENDELLYIFDWGDGSLPFETNAPFASYTYPENVYRDYPLSVMATDGLQQSSEYTDTISIAQPPTNQAPEVQDIEIIVSPRGVVDVRVIASDPEGDMFEITVDWGDATQDEETPILRGGQGRHRYAYRPDRSPYVGQLVLTDLHGAVTETEFSLSIPDASTEINQTDVTHLGNGLVHISVMASDLDSPNQLLHSFDFDSDFVFERPSRLSGSAFYQYPQPGRYQVNVLLTDPWSGQTTTHGIIVDVPDWLPEPTLPSFDRVLWNASPGGLVQLTIEIADPDDLVEEVEVSWGDEDVSGSVERVINETMQHRYVFQSEPYLGRVTARTTEGVEVSSA